MPGHLVADGVRDEPVTSSISNNEDPTKEADKKMDTFEQSEVKRLIQTCECLL